MLRILEQSLKTGVVTEPPPAHGDAELERLGIEIRRRIDARFAGRLAIRQVDAGSCNGCELEIHALDNPYYDLERFGIHFVASPRHADALLVTGPVSRHMETAHQGKRPTFPPLQQVRTYLSRRHRQRTCPLQRHRTHLSGRTSLHTRPARDTFLLRLIDGARRLCRDGCATPCHYA